MSEKKKVQVRFQTTSSTSGTINHDFRLSKVSYLRTEMYHNKFKNEYFQFEPNQLKKQATKSYQEYNILYKAKHKRNLQKHKQSDFLTGVITLSPIVNEWLENEVITKQELDKAFTDSIPLIEAKIHNIANDNSIKLSHFVIHYDEKTPHMHFAFYNHTRNGEAVYNIMRNSGRLSEFQDIVGETFKEIGLERGERKSTAKHMSVVKMHEEELKQLKKEIKSEIKNLQEVKKELKSTVEDKKELKNQLDSIDKSIKNAREELKRENSTIDSLKVEKERLRASMDDLRPINEEDIDIYDIDSIIDYVTKTNTYTVKDGILQTKNIEITEFVNETKLREILTEYNDNLKKVIDAPIYNQKLEKELEIAKAKAKSYLGLNQRANERVKELEEELNDYRQTFNELDEILMTETDNKAYLDFNEVIERVKNNKEELKSKTKELEIAKERIEYLENELKSKKLKNRYD